MAVAQKCILGAEMSDSASEAALTEAYVVSASEARSVKPDYAPETVNTDGGAATQNAWRHWFPKIAVILSFLHAFTQYVIALLRHWSIHSTKQLGKYGKPIKLRSR